MHFYFSTVPPYFIWVKYLSWLGYANEVLLVNQWDGVRNITCVENYSCRFKTGDDVLTVFGMKKASKII